MTDVRGTHLGSETSGASANPAPLVYSEITVDPLDAALIEHRLLAADNAAEHGALVTFRGIVRNHDHGVAVTGLEYQAHPDAARFLRECCHSIANETGLSIAAVHRIGQLTVGDTALVAVVAAAHRGEAFAACDKLVDLIKSTLPIWKRQYLVGGITEWVGL